MLNIQWLKKNVTNPARGGDISNFIRSAELLGRLIAPPTAARFTRAFFCTFVTAVLLYAKHLGDIFSWIITHPTLRDVFYKSVSHFTTSFSGSTELLYPAVQFCRKLVENSTFLQWPRPRHISDQSCNSCGNSQTSQKMEKLIFSYSPGSENRACKSLNATFYYLQQFIFHCSVNRKWNKSYQHSNYETFSDLSEVLELLPSCCLFFIGCKHRPSLVGGHFITVQYSL